MDSEKFKDIFMGVFFFLFSIILVYLLTLPKQRAMIAEREAAEAAAAAEAKQNAYVVVVPQEAKLAAEKVKNPDVVFPTLPDVDINSWEFTTSGYGDSVGTSYFPEVCNIEDQYVDIRIKQQTKDFLKAAREEGLKAWIGVGLRNTEYLLYWYDKAMIEYGSSYEAAKHADPPGCTEHSLGLAIDITDKDFYAANYYNMHDEEMADSETYKWMAEHCAEYGFIVRYPEGKEDIYGKGCYTGHFRYVGVEAAKFIMENDLCLEEFIALYK